MYIDTHCHISEEDYDNIEKIIENIGNNIAIISGADEKSNYEVVKLCNKYKNIYGTLGIHPGQIDNLSDDIFGFIEQNINNPKIVGIGEIGLDYYYKNDNKQKQKEIFIKQIEIALKYNKPIVIHSREAAQDTYDILKNYDNLKKVLHCYSYTLEMANLFAKINVKFGIGGVITFKNAKNLVNVVENINIKDILLETDSPWLTPEPIRGTKNEPKNIPLIAKKIAEIKKMEIASVLQITTNNAINQFDLKI
ncbi:MAG: TatD family hydrolase [Bacilli bacterium]|nr:TatD family hydrolase [Bacilli bacterium]